MKDLKHYFSSPGGSDNDVPNENEIVSKKRRIKCITENLEYTSDAPSLKKKRKKPSNDCDNQNNINIKSDKKRKKHSGEKSSKKLRTSKLCENVNVLQTTEEYSENLVINNSKEDNDNSKENNLDSTVEFNGKSPENNSLHNYFNKVDKAPDILLKANILKVEAVVHYPPPSEEIVKPLKRLKTRLRRRKSIDLRPEYDIITSEEDNSSLQNSKNDISLNGFIEIDDTSEEILTSPESVQESSLFSDSISTVNGNGAVPTRIKRDGTLNSFFKKPNRTSNILPIVISEERKIAKREFLNSGIPDKMKKQITKKTDSMLLRAAPFPKHHVRQIDKLSLMWNLKVVNLEFKNNFDHLINLPTWSCITEYSSKNKNITDKVNNSSSSCFDKKSIKKLKKENSGYPTGKWHSELVKMKNANTFDMWSEKYKPKSSLQLIGNSNTVGKLKSWLQALNSNKNSSKKDNETYCSEDEFQKSDDDLVLIKNAAFLQGPPGSGKTATVYALAEEIGYQILEINSSCNRMGKKILHEFSEALQSHKVERNVLNFNGSKKNKIEDSRKSLILIEDIDVIFPEYDDGFISTIANLAANSKRPIIFTINEYYPKYLSKIMPYTNFRLDYETLPQSKVCSWIRTVAAAENVFLDETEAGKLVQWANGDIRKLLLQLQFSFANSSKLVFSDNQQVGNLWKNLGSQSIDDLKETENTSKLYNLLTVCDILNGSITTEECANDKYFDQPWRTVLKDSCEFNQPNDSLDYTSRNILSDMVQVLKENIYSSNMEDNLLSPKTQSIIPIIEREILTPSSVLSHTSVATDYLSSLRIIARSEIKRLEAHSKRNNRYFSYLQSLGITQNTINISNILSESLNSTL
ncbi:hypothetical protein O3M35_011505 [Rhynocoris fuscipes]|uniref:ATPase AAA-type core domain-containing protein n=1 Tax=Rhynocoris fuscipes TaxID=488301 RepID=A0AAW1CWH4_9HEMI